MSEIKAIETEYNGYRFRSRLEARWAVFFDAMGIKYEYEPEGYEYEPEEEDGEFAYRWLPDFRLPDENNLLVEVKGSDEALAKDGDRLALAVDYHNTPASDGLLILGNIPSPYDVGWGKIPVFSYLSWSKGVHCDYAAFVDWSNPFKPKRVVRGIKEIFHGLYGYNRKKFKEDYADGFDGISDVVSTQYKVLSDSDIFSTQHKKLKKAYEIARQARFEHGETPTVDEIRKKMEAI